MKTRRRRVCSGIGNTMRERVVDKVFSRLLFFIHTPRAQAIPYHLSTENPPQAGLFWLRKYLAQKGCG